MPIGDPPRLLVVLPSWVGDAIMATPALRMIRQERPGVLIGVLARPGIDQLLGGTGLFDEAHPDRGTGVMAPKAAAAKLRARRYRAAILLKNSFSSALTVRLAGIPRRVGYARDARSLLLTDSLDPALTPRGQWAIVPAVRYYLDLAAHFLGRAPLGDAPLPPMELCVTPDDALAGAEVLARAGIDPLGESPLAVLNPGGNNPAKRWPTDRFARVADFLSQEHGLTVLVNGSPSEAPLVAEVCAACHSAKPIALPAHGGTIPALKAILARSRLLVTNDTGPRHIAAALGTPVVTLFGPTDHRWTSIATHPLADGSPSEELVLADPTLPESESANDHPERCRIERVSVPVVLAACSRLLSTPAQAPPR